MTAVEGKKRVFVQYHCTEFCLLLALVLSGWDDSDRFGTFSAKRIVRIVDR